MIARARIRNRAPALSVPACHQNKFQVRLPRIFVCSRLGFRRESMVSGDFSSLSNCSLFRAILVVSLKSHRRLTTQRSPSAKEAMSSNNATSNTHFSQGLRQKSLSLTNANENPSIAVPILRSSPIEYPNCAIVVLCHRTKLSRCSFDSVIVPFYRTPRPLWDCLPSGLGADSIARIY
jgi:hypothetical protein